MILKNVTEHSPSVNYQRQEALSNVQPHEGTDMDTWNCSIGCCDKWAMATAREGRGSRTGRRGAMEDLLKKQSKGRALKIQELALRCRKASLHWAEGPWCLQHAQKGIQGEREKMAEEGGELTRDFFYSGRHLLVKMSPKYFDAVSTLDLCLIRSSLK